MLNRFVFSQKPIKLSRPRPLPQNVLIKRKMMVSQARKQASNITCKTSNKIHIDICVPYFLYNGCPNRITITRKKMENLLYLKNVFHDKANFTFTFIGSENELSKSLFDTYFQDKPETANYYEFYQESVNPGYNDTFLNMLTEKFKFSFNKSIEKKPNITLLNGSNDFISFNFFEQIINNYNSTKSQLFGMDNFLNGRNCTNILLYDNNKNIFIDQFLWTGIQPGREQYKYIGGIIGWNDTFYNLNKDCWESIVSFDEGLIESNSCSISTTEKFNSIDCFFLNIKCCTGSSSDVTPFDVLKNFETKGLSRYITQKTKKNIMGEREKFIRGYK